MVGGMSCWLSGQWSAARREYCCRHRSAVTDYPFLFCVWDTSVVSLWSWSASVVSFAWSWPCCSFPFSLVRCCSPPLFLTLLCLVVARSLVCAQADISYVSFCLDLFLTRSHVLHRLLLVACFLACLLSALCSPFPLCPQHQPVAENSSSVPARQQRLGVSKIRAVAGRVAGDAGAASASLWRCTTRRSWLVGRVCADLRVLPALLLPGPPRRACTPTAAHCSRRRTVGRCYA